MVVAVIVCADAEQRAEERESGGGVLVAVSHLIGRWPSAPSGSAPSGGADVGADEGEEHGGGGPQHPGVAHHGAVGGALRKGKHTA